MMHKSRRVTIVAILLALIVAGAANRSDAAPIDLLNDNFNGETAGTQFGGSYNLNYNSFSNFNVSRGSVDLINNATGWGTNVGITGHGLFVDLNGSTSAAGQLQSKTDFTLSPGTYVLSFDLAGSQRNDERTNNTVAVSLGSIFSQAITLPFTAPFGTQTFTFTTGSTSSGNLIFDSLDGRNQGLLLDNVRLTFDPAATPVPEPASLLLWGLGAVGMVGFERRRRRAQAARGLDALPS